MSLAAPERPFSQLGTKPQWAMLSDEERDVVVRLAHLEPSIESVAALAALQYRKLTDDQRRVGFGGPLTIAEIDATGIPVELQPGFFAEQ